MTEQDVVSASVREILASCDESRFPDAFLAEYDIVECLGAGQWNETLLVENRSTGQRAVAKRYDAARVGANGEGALLRGLSHPGLPAYLGEYRNESGVIVVRAFLPGKTLAEAAAERQFTQEEILRIGIGLCGVLSYLHRQTPPVIHRDIKPENIVLAENGQVGLIDFGISRVFDAGAATDTVQFGTAKFAPPEQYGFSQTDCRSDIFSLGMVLTCLLTGRAERMEEQAGAKGALARLLWRATAFSPKERFGSAAELARALRAQLPGAKRRRRIAIPALAVLLVASVLLVRAVWAGAMHRGVTFAEPVIGQAVRAVLGKAPGAPVTEEELLLVEGLYVFGPTVVASAAEFYAAAEAWYAAPERVYGGITSLADAARLPNLRELCLAAQPISDLSPLRTLVHLEKAELKHDSVQDISVLPELPSLASVGLNDNPVSDFSPLGRCTGLRFLDLCDNKGYDPAFLDALGDFEFLDIACSDEAYRHLGTRRIRELKAGCCAFDSLSYLDGISGLTMLELKDTRLSSLAGVERHTLLTYLNVARCPITDLAPVLSLPALQTLVLSRDQQPLAEALGTVGFSIEYQS